MGNLFHRDQKDETDEKSDRIHQPPLGFLFLWKGNLTISFVRINMKLRICLT